MVDGQLYYPRVLRGSLGVLFVAALALACGAAGQGAGSTTLSAAVARRLDRGVFEVVVPRPHDGATYAMPLPEDLLPTYLRNAKFLPLGTAFALSPTLFVTNAHVILGVPESSMFLRDASGTTYEVSRIRKFSQDKDIALFELDRAPPDLVPLETRRPVEVGEAVLAVGNAAGRGIIVRSGALLNPESASGDRGLLRFSAPISPGNSGGPLIDPSGRVMGIVQSTMNRDNLLNYAIPMAELETLGGEQADFARRGVPIKEDGHESLVDVKYSAPLPSSLGDLQRAARRSFVDAMSRQYAEFDAQFGRDLFPNSPGLQPRLQEPDIPIGFGVFRVDGNGAWSTSRPTPEQHQSAEVAPGQQAFLLVNADKMGGEVLLDRPKGVPLSTFFESPKALADTIVRTYSWTVTFAGRQIGVASLGMPSEKEEWTDDYGRPWFTFLWRLPLSRESVIFNCLTNPAGWACFWNRAPTSFEEVAPLVTKRWARRVMFSYFGRIGDWVEFLALPERYRPKILRDASVRFDQDLTLSVGPLRAEHIRLPSLTRESSLYASVSVDASSLHEQRIYQAKVNPRIQNTDSFGIQEILAPLPGSPEVQAKRWATLQGAAAPFDGVPAVEAGTMNAIKRGIKATAKSERDRMYLEFCRNPVNESKATLKASCATFHDALKLDVRP